MLPGQPVAHNLGLLCLNSWLLWGMVAYDFGLLGSPGKLSFKLHLAGLVSSRAEGTHGPSGAAHQAVCLAQVRDMHGALCWVL